MIMCLVLRDHQPPHGLALRVQTEMNDGPRTTILHAWPKTAAHRSSGSFGIHPSNRSLVAYPLKSEALWKGTTVPSQEGT